MAKTGLLLTLIAVMAGPAQAACPGVERTIRDPALHRMWKMERDCAHPQRPARLVEIAWKGTRGPVSSPAAAPVVRPGARVIVGRQDGGAHIHLEGTALEGGRLGESILVRAGLRGATLRGVVRGPGRVELEPEKARY